jgi:hypothetical protein
MNYFDKLNNDVYNLIMKYIGNKDFYNFADTYKIRGLNNIKRLIEYCGDEGEDVHYAASIGYDDSDYHFIFMIDFDNYYNVKYLAKHFRLKMFSPEIQKNKELVLEFIKKDPYNLRYAHVKFLDDKDIMMLVVRKYGGIVEHISERLTDDDDIIDIAIKSNKIAIIFASDSIKSKYTELLKEVNAWRRCETNILLRENYYFNKELTEDKYVKMRKLYDDNRKKEQKAREIREEKRKKEEEYRKDLDEEYRKRHNLSEHAIIYRNDFMEVISQQDYLDDYYNNHYYYIDGYD